VRLFHDRLEYRFEIAGGRVDDFHHLGHGGLSRQRFVALGCALAENSFQLLNPLPQTHVRVVGHRLRASPLHATIPF
jgi:hypothetical protein